MAKKQPGHGKQHVVAKHPAPHKPAKQSHGGGKGVSGKHSGAHKHKSVPAKHHPSKQKRTLALGEAVGCCAAEALAASLRLAGGSVNDQDVLALYRRTAEHPDDGATILATLEAAAEHGIAGVRPASFRLLDFDDPAIAAEGVILGVDLPGPHAVAVCAEGHEWMTWGECWPVRWLPDAVLEEAWAITWL
jgi:hypothetical protein